MEIVPYTPALLPSITALVNAHIAQIPPGWAVTEEQVAATLAGARALWSLHYPDNGEAWEQATLCALDRGQLAAAAQWIYPANGVDTRARADPLIGTESWVFAQSGQIDALHLLPVLSPAYNWTGTRTRKRLSGS